MQIKVKYVNNGFAQLKEKEKNFLLNAPVVVKILGITLKHLHAQHRLTRPIMSFDRCYFRRELPSLFKPVVHVGL